MRQLRDAGLLYLPPRKANGWPWAMPFALEWSPLRLLFAGRRARVPVAQQGITPLEVIKLITQQDLRSGPRVLLESEMQQQYLFC